MTERPEYYVLDGKTPRAATYEQYGLWRAHPDNRKLRRVAKTETDDFTVSTVFLGMDHGWADDPPLIFETLVFGGPLDGECEQCSNWEQAEAQHEAMVKRAKEATP